MEKRRWAVLTTGHLRVALLLAAIVVGVASVQVRAQTATGVRFVQWPVFNAIGGGIRVDRAGDPSSESPAGTIWATTRQDDPKLIRLVPGAPLESEPAAWTAWNLASGPDQNAMGIVITPSDQVFVRTSIGLQRIDPSTNMRTVWPDGFSNSDLALGADQSIWSALPLGPVQRLVPDGPSLTGATVTSWFVGGSGEIALAGLAMHAASGLVYFSDNGGDVIGELDPASHRVRRWSTAAVGATRPRQLSIDPSGDIWALSKSNHIVRLRPATNELTAFVIPTAGSEPYGIFADGVIGFTGSESAKLSLLIPTGSPVVSAPVVATVLPTSFLLVGEMDGELPATGTVAPIVTTVSATAVGSEATGYFIEAAIPNSFGALGIDRNPADPPGTFYYTDYGTRLIGQASLPLPEEALVTGGGWIDVAGIRGHFSFSVFRKDPGGPVKGRFQYKNQSTGETIKSEEITDLLVYGNNAILSGTMTVGGVSGTFTVQVSDHGEPGTNDTFRMVAVPGSTVSNTLAGGNIQIHRRD